MTYNDLSEKDQRYYAKFRRIAELHNARSKEDVLAVVKSLSSIQMKSIPIISFIIAIGCGLLSADDMSNGGIPVLLPVISILFLWVGVQNLRSITTTIPMIAEIYIQEDLPKRQKVSKKAQKRIDQQDAKNDQ